MPEGDTIHKLAAALRKELLGAELGELWLRQAGEVDRLSGEEVGPVDALGKHLLLGLGEDWLLRTHLRLGGDVHRYTDDEGWRRPRSEAVAILAAGDRVYVWFEPAEAELFRARDLPGHPRLSRLGQDLLGERLDFEAVVQRARATGEERLVADVLLDQTVAAGIGNIYKSEVLFLAGVSPFTRLQALDDTQVAGLYLTAREMMHRNVGPGPRTTRNGSGPKGSFLPGEPRLWVYKRTGKRCLLCGTAVRVTTEGEQGRATYHCPSCQS